ncbi:MAG: hypothetical protein OXC37_02035 [Bdellovibrionaceae bacterium]|nr:hypothetical protein [Pseudobdellovibrionaceae bacterium]
MGVGESFANKKYRYIKREHGVRFQGNIPMSFNQGFALSANLGGAYAYNWKGYLEIGPYFNLNLEAGQTFELSSWSIGLLGEYNFIKNRGKRKFIPSLGLTVGADKSFDFPNLAMGVHSSLKIFVGKRTAFITSLGYSLHTPFNEIFRVMQHHVDVMMAFSYYFDFY